MVIGLKQVILDLVDSWLHGIFFPRRQLASRFVVTGTTNSSLETSKSANTTSCYTAFM